MLNDACDTTWTRELRRNFDTAIRTHGTKIPRGCHTKTSAKKKNEDDPLFSKRRLVPNHPRALAS